MGCEANDAGWGAGFCFQNFQKCTLQMLQPGGFLLIQYNHILLSNIY